MAAKKKNKDYGSRATNAVITVLASVAVNKGIDAIKTQPFMQNKAVKYGMFGGGTAVGLGVATMVDSQIAQAFGTGISSGCANKLVDEFIPAGAMGIGNVDDYLNLYEKKDLGRTEVSEVQFNGVDDLVIQ